MKSSKAVSRISDDQKSCLSKNRVSSSDRSYQEEIKDLAFELNTSNQNFLKIA